MRHIRLLAVAGVGMMAVVGCIWFISAKSKAQAGKPGPAEPPKKLTIDLGGGVKMEFVLIQPGSFTRGKGKAAHKVTLTKPFYLGKYEVTQEQWEKVMGSNPSDYKGAKNPVETVSWDDCQGFLTKLKESRGFLTKLKEKVSGHTFRLPTEAEWEYACRAGSTGDYCYGNGDGQLGDYAWFLGNAGLTTHPVGGKKANAWGLHDMHGNVSEWCSDWHEDYPTTAVTDPEETTSSKCFWRRVVRGGSVRGSEGLARCAYRDKRDPASRNRSDIGFRLVRSPVP